MLKNILLFIFLYFVILGFNCLANNDANKEKLLKLDKQNKALFAKVKSYTDKLLTDQENKAKLINIKLKNLSEDPESFNVKEINQAIKDAMQIAETNGLDTDRLQKLFKLSKKIILESEFKQYKDDETTFVGKKFNEWFDWVLLGDEKVAMEAAKIMEHKVELYKKVNIAFLRALIEKNPEKSYQNFRNYVKALHSIQSADADVLIAEAENLVAEQKLVNDIATGIPLLGDSIDIISIINGEDLSGHQLSNLEKAITILSLATPEIITQVLKRNPYIAKSLGKIGATIRNAPKKVILNISKKIKNTDELIVLLNKSPSPEVLKWREFYTQKINEAKKLAVLDGNTKKVISESLEKKLSNTFVRKPNLSNDINSKIIQTAQKRDEVILLRPVSDNMEQRLAEGAYTKGMNVKGKSASEGIAKGYVPRNQKFSKLKDADEIKKFQAKVDESLQTETINVNNKKITITPQRVKSKQLKIKKNGVELEAIEIPTKDGKESIAVFKTQSGEIVDENMNKLSKKVLKNYDLKKSKPFEVLTDMNGNYLTADIDLLSVGSKKKETIVHNDELMGNINFNEMGTVQELNRSLKSEKYPDRQLVHHGGENRFINQSSKLDFPITAYSPDGKIAVLKNENELKKYYHMQKLKGYDLQPNPYWDWGEWDPKSGYK